MLKLRINGLISGENSLVVVESTDCSGVATQCLCLRLFDVECCRECLFVLINFVEYTSCGTYPFI